MARTQRRTETHTFRNPVLFSTIGQELPAGTYTFTIEEQEIVTGAGAHWFITRCTVPVPQSMVPPHLLGVDAGVEYAELCQKVIDDRAPPSAP